MPSRARDPSSAGSPDGSPSRFLRAVTQGHGVGAPAGARQQSRSSSASITISRSIGSTMPLWFRSAAGFQRGRPGVLSSARHDQDEVVRHRCGRRRRRRRGRAARQWHAAVGVGVARSWSACGSAAWCAGRRRVRVGWPVCSSAARRSPVGVTATQRLGRRRRNRRVGRGTAVSVGGGRRCRSGRVRGGLPSRVGGGRGGGRRPGRGLRAVAVGVSVRERRRVGRRRRRRLGRRWR